MRKLILALVAAAAVLGTAVPATAADLPDLSISRVGYNANGADVWTNRNQEYVDVTNVGTVPVDVKGLTVEDSWARAAGDDNPRGCNTYTVASLPGVVETDGQVLLPVGHTVRVYTGSGTAAVFGTGGRFHAVFMNSRCGYHGHYLNNGADTVYVSLGGAAESLSYDFGNGYYIR
jgi:hypothetical protein